METIAILNQKGGVGKSTTALAMGAGLFLKGYSILYVDLDAQGNLSFSINVSSKGYGAMGILQRPETIEEEIQGSPQGDIAASSPALATADAVLTETGKEYRLREALGHIARKYDYCLIDTPPALGILTVNALTACTGAIIPAQADIFSLQGIGQLNNTIQTVKKYCNPTLRIKGIVLTRYNPRSVITREVTALLEDTARELKTKLYQTKIRECTAIKEAQAVQRNIYDYAPKSNASADYKALTEEFLREER